MDGSDTTAIAIAAALKAKHCYIFSDVDGVYTTDPNKVANAKKLENLSYVEMLDIANEGAKVLHDRCIEIGEKFKIPIITKSTFNNKTGSIINEKIEENTVKSIIKNDDLFLVNLKCSSYSINVFHQVYNCLIKHNIVPIHFINNSSSVFNVNFLIKSNVFNKFQRCLDTELNMFNASFINVSRIAIVGYGIANNGKMLENILAIIKNFGIDILNVDVTNTKVVITFKEKVDNDLLDALHCELFENN